MKPVLLAMFDEADETEPLGFLKNYTYSGVGLPEGRAELLLACIFEADRSFTAKMYLEGFERETLLKTDEPAPDDIFEEAEKLLQKYKDSNIAVLGKDMSVVCNLRETHLVRYGNPYSLRKYILTIPNPIRLNNWYRDRDNRKAVGEALIQLYSDNLIGHT